MAIWVGACRAPAVAEQPVASGPPGEAVRYERFSADNASVIPVAETKRSGRTSYEHYLPDTLNPRFLPVKVIHLNFHVMNTVDSFYDFHGDKARDFIGAVVAYGNAKLADNPESWLVPDSMDVPALPTRLRYEIATDPGTGQPAIYEHFDDELYSYLHGGPHKNRSDRRVIQRYAVRTGSELNIFFMGPPRDYFGVRGFTGNGVNGIFLGNAIKVTGMLSNDPAPWTVRQVLSHEIGHALGLHHAWMQSDGCPDTPTHANRSWRAEKRGPGLTSNNLMDYSPNQSALTPCQIGRMHERLSRLGSRERRWAKPDWCKYRYMKAIRVSDRREWHGDRDYNSDLVIEAGGDLYLNARVHFPEGAAIKVEPGGRLILGPRARLHNACGASWRGIHAGTDAQGIRGIVELQQGASVLNVEDA